jgi:hypothetical protein
MRLRTILALAGAAAVLGGCVYDPYTGTYVPCCNYYGYPNGYGYGYGYPRSYYYRPAPYGYPQGGYPQGPYNGPQQGPYGAPPPGQPGAGGPPPQPGAAAQPTNGGGLAQRFAAANATHDGRLTRAQAAGTMPMVARNFDAIDLDHKGYVTLPEIRSFAAERRAGQSSAGG